ncbi:MAG: diguanylate cyclase [Dehalococcoidia bacterium]|nr:diguanylate cyclase [Dehalococcoidia bacterium]
MLLPATSASRTCRQLESIAQLRALEPSAGIVAVTGLVDVDVAVQSMKAGADDFVAKPFDPEILWHVLNKAIDNRKQRIEANQAEAYRQLAYTDALTGVSNRRYIDEFLEETVAQARNNGQAVAVGFVDIDNFKLLNDFVGHEQGDSMLRSMARELELVVEAPDVFGRFGGDEFVVVFPGRSEAHANLVLDRLRARVDRIDVTNSHQIHLPTRISCGVAELTGEESPRDLIARAEDRMYLDKSLAPTVMAAVQQNARPENLVQVGKLKTLRSLVKAIDRRDSYTRFHSDHATHLALRVAKQLGLDEEEVNALMIGGPVHDLGKIVVPDEILRKPGALTSEERRQMEEHPVVGAAITAAVTDYDAVVNLVRHHHERWDGEGYPGRLKQLDNALPTRLFCVADAFSAMTTDRPYRRALTYEQALAEVRRGAGSQFDPDLAVVFADTIEREYKQDQDAA